MARLGSPTIAGGLRATVFLLALAGSAFTNACAPHTANAGPTPAMNMFLGLIG